MVLQLSEKKSILANWYKYLECRHELETLVSQDRERLQKLVCQRENGRRVPHKDLLAELEVCHSTRGSVKCYYTNLYPRVMKCIQRC